MAAAIPAGLLTGQATGPVPGKEPVPLGLARIEHQFFDPASGKPFGFDDHIYFPDLMRSYGLDCRMEQFDDGRRNSFTDMIAAMLPRLHSPEGRLDIAILSGVTPDAQPVYPMCFLNAAPAGPELSFAIFDQGVITPFTALSVLGAYVRARSCARAMLLIMDQSARLHTAPVPARLRVDRDCAVALVWDADQAFASMVVPPSVLAVAAGDVAAGVADLLHAHAAGGRDGPRVLICGYGLAGRLPERTQADAVLQASAGQPGTGVWSLLAARMPDWRANGARVVVADYEEDQHRLGACVIEVNRRQTPRSC